MKEAVSEIFTRWDVANLSSADKDGADIELDSSDRDEISWERRVLLIEEGVGTAIVSVTDLVTLFQVSWISLELVEMGEEKTEAFPLAADIESPSEPLEALCETKALIGTVVLGSRAELRSAFITVTEE